MRYLTNTIYCAVIAYGLYAFYQWGPEFRFVLHKLSVFLGL